ncbi:MAG TPA: nuclear transport factor 2 family protein [Ramlibacter sp.]|uniref:YybH family protein n=1 Tax=Ramlibacter sp. TaxID=1917967 RepID=UPI002C6CB36B|nr:nuclear transport factor 2 family protein [Ramlibacter sp.]HVZ45820.1 nuclear transport factor 2 family protein [Ramlibacter sp.]
MDNTPVPAAVSQLLQQWKLAFEARDVDRLAALYTQDAFLFGGKPALSAGRRAIRDYFDSLPAVVLRADFEQQCSGVLAASVISTAGFLSFRREGGLPSRYRLTLALVRIAGEWKIASHHASPCPPEPQPTEPA